MAVFKCKECGGDLNVTEGQKICTCEFCESVQTVPSSDNEKKVNLFNRADRLRFNGDYDKAANIYESIVAEFPEEAEAYWGLCLCKYGIEYVDDPSTGRKMPTCHRTSYESIFNDSNFSNVMKLADGETVSLYQSRAQEIDRIQKRILDIVRNESPYDIFICYKESTEDRQRTEDSVIAQDIYEDLTKDGYKVFFSRITLEDKLGVEFEPYIFAALNSAKVMLAFGTRYEYFDAIWVKNEWNRFLSLMKNDKSKMLIPCYRDIDPSEMPQEFRGLQGQDMSKLGFKQDLMRGIGKIIPKGTKSGSGNHTVNVPKEIVATVDSMLTRVFDDYLPDHHWNEAYQACDKVLDSDPTNARAFLGKLLADLNMSDEHFLKYCNQDFEANENYRKALKYSTPEKAEKLRGDLAAVLYKMGNEAMEAKNYRHACFFFKRIKDYEDSSELLEKCRKENGHYLDCIKEFRETYRRYDMSIDAPHSEETNQYIEKFNYMKNKYSCFPQVMNNPQWVSWLLGAGVVRILTVLINLSGNSSDTFPTTLLLLGITWVIVAIIARNKLTYWPGFTLAILPVAAAIGGVDYLMVKNMPIAVYTILFSLEAIILILVPMKKMKIKKRYDNETFALNDLYYKADQALNNEINTKFYDFIQKYPNLSQELIQSALNEAHNSYK